MPHRLTLSRMAQMIRQRRLSPVELIDALLKQAERLNPQLNAFIEVYADAARRSAENAEQTLVQEGARGCLFGVPVTIKDSLDVARHFTFCGSLLRRGVCAARNSAPVD